MAGSLKAFCLVFLSMIAVPVECRRTNARQTDRLQTDAESEVAEKKRGSGKDVSYRFEFKDATGNGNQLGSVVIEFPQGGQLTNQGFFQGSTGVFQPNSILGKADDYVWNIGGMGTSFPFNHGASEFVLGNVQSSGGMCTPEFEEVVFGKNGNTPDMIMRNTIQEEKRENTLKMGEFHPDGYMKLANPPQTSRYAPRLRLKPGKGQATPVGKGKGNFWMASMERPYILDIDNLFTTKPLVPAQFRTNSEVMQDRTYSFAEINSTAATGSVPVQIRVDWSVPVVQKFRCVDVAAEFTKGGAALFVAMGWDTEQVNGVDLDLDIALVPFDGKKNALWPKTVWYNSQRPTTLGCGGGRNLAMNGYVDDQSGDEPGDDELMRIDLTCLDQHHSEVEAVALLVNIFKPATSTWSEIDSAYLRIISGGTEQAVQGDGGKVDNYYIRGAEGVRSYVRLSGNDLKSDPDLGQNGLVVGLFFKEKSGKWAFAATLKGLSGRNVERSLPHMKALMQDLVYPANEHWDQTSDMQQSQQMGAKKFADDGILEKFNPGKALYSGKLPCISSRADKAKIMMGAMTNDDLQKVIHNPKVNAVTKATAQKFVEDPLAKGKMAKMAAVTKQVEAATTDAARAQAGKQILNKQMVVPAPAPAESAANLDDLDSMFDDI